MFKAELLTRFNGVMRRDAENFTDEFSEEIGGMSGNCIDIGTGAGDVTADFILPKLDPNATLLCADVSEDMVNYGKKTYGNIDRLSFVKLNIEAPELPKDLVGQFDHLTSLYCLHWCYDLRRALENMYSLLRPGGTALVTFLSSFRGLGLYAELQATPKYENYIKDAHRIIPPFQDVALPRKTLMALLKDIGFHPKICSCRSMNYVFDTLDNVRGYLLAASPFNTDDMPADLKDEFVNDATRVFMDHEIVFKKNPSNKDECSILARYNTFVVYLKKPASE